jgi:dihydropteroate synthase
VTGSYPPRRIYRLPLPHGGTLVLGERPLVMGILNITPDSLSGSLYGRDPRVAIDRALRLEADGADILDIGGESTRPGSTPVPADEEVARVLPVLRGLAGRLRVPISIDTYKAEVAEVAVTEGAVIINDVSGLRYDPSLGRTAARLGAAMVLMHMRGRPATMYAEAAYEDVVDEVIREMGDSLRLAQEAGVAADRIIVDPGIGFAKRAAHSYGVLARLPEIAEALDRPLLAGPSRKSFLNEAIGTRAPDERDWATAAAVTAAVLGGAHIVRVHAVAEMTQVVRVAERLRQHA